MIPEAPAEVERMRKDLGLLGCKLGPIYQDVHPLSAGFLRVCSTLQRLEMPLIIHQGATFVQSGPLIHSIPILIDEVARIHPELRIVVTHMGHPWIQDTIVVMRKQPNVYADVSAIHPRPWQLYQALLAASEYRAVDKLVFGSDYPFMGVEETMQGLRNVNEFSSWYQPPENLRGRYRADHLSTDAESPGDRVMLVVAVDEAQRLLPLLGIVKAHF